MPVRSQCGHSAHRSLVHQLRRSSVQGGAEGVRSGQRSLLRQVPIKIRGGSSLERRSVLDTNGSATPDVIINVRRCWAPRSHRCNWIACAVCRFIISRLAGNQPL